MVADEHWDLDPSPEVEVECQGSRLAHCQKSDRQLTE